MTENTNDGTPAPGGDENGGQGGGQGVGLMLTLEGDRPEAVPQKYWDPARRSVNVQAILDNERGLMQKVTDLTAPRVPKDGYALNLPAHLADSGIDQEDKIFQAAAAFAREHNLPQDAMDGLVAAYFAAVPTPEAVAEGLRADWGDTTDAEIKANTTWLDAHFEGDDLAALKVLEYTADGQKALKALRAMQAGPKAIDTRDGATSAAGTLTEADLERMKQDPRYWDPNKRDENFVRQVRAGYEKLFPE